MKICWDNLNGLIYNKKLGCLVFKRVVKSGKNIGKTTNRYFYFRKCDNCGKDIISRNKKEQSFCNNSCHWFWLHKNKTDIEKKAIADKISRTKRKEKIHSFEWYIKKYGLHEGIQKKFNAIDSTKNNKENFIKKYGLENGEKKYNNYIENLKKSHSKDGYIKRYGEYIGNQKWNEFIKKSKYYSSYKYYEKKYGNFAKEKFISDKSSGWKWYSKESLKIFLNLKDWLIENDISTKKDIYFGKNEYFLSVKNESIYFYDFTVKNINLIIEYNGIHVHPVDENNLKWRHAYTNENASLVKKKDNHKINIAKNKGFNIIEIWSDHAFEENIEMCKNFILENLA